MSNTIINAGCQNTIFLEAGNVFVVVTDANTSGVAYGKPNATFGLNSTTQIGPFQEGQSYNITCSTGSLNIQELLFSTVAPKLAQDANNNTVGIVGADGRATNITSQKGHKTVVFGDSMSQMHQFFWFGSSVVTLTRSSGVATVNIVGSGMQTGRKIRVINCIPSSFNCEATITRIDANNFSYASAGPDGSASDLSGISVIDRTWVHPGSYIQYANQLLKGRLQVTKNLGIGGNKTDQMLARINDVLDQSPSICVVLGGYNDIGAFTSSQTIANLTAIYDILASKNILVVAMTMIPLASGGTKFSAVNVEYTLAVNRAIRNYCMTSKNVVLADCFRLMVDKNATTNKGSSLPNMIHADNVHQSNRGAYMMGKSIYNVINSLVPQTAWSTSTCSAESSGNGVSNFNVIENAPSIATGGAVSAPVTGVAATGITVERNAGSTGASVASVVTDTDGTLFQRLAITAGGTESWNARSNTGGTIVTKFTTGESRRLSARIKTSGIIGSGLLNMTLTGSITVDGIQYVCTIGQTGQLVPAWPEDFDGVFIGEPMIIPVGAVTNASWTLTSYFNAVGTAINIDIGDVAWIISNEDPA
jgi:lysophospholipase L1-like esterase